jgi:hypothetical protein
VQCKLLKFILLKHDMKTVIYIKGEIKKLKYIPAKYDMPTLKDLEDNDYSLISLPAHFLFILSSFHFYALLLKWTFFFFSDEFSR